MPRAKPTFLKKGSSVRKKLSKLFVCLLVLEGGGGRGGGEGGGGNTVPIY